MGSKEAEQNEQQARKRKKKRERQAKSRAAHAPSRESARIFKDAAAAYETGNLDKALLLASEAWGIDASNGDAVGLLGLLYGRLGQWGDALTALEEASHLQPSEPLHLFNLGWCCQQLQRLAEAAAAYEAALELKPDLYTAIGNLAGVRLNQGRVEEAEAFYRRALEIKPSAANPSDVRVRMGLLGASLYRNRSSVEVFDLHVEHGTAIEESAGPGRPRHLNGRDPERRLRVAYLSADFRRHSCASFLEPLLASHDPEAVEVFALAEVANPDAVTERFHRIVGADHWHNTVGMDDGDVEALVRRLRIDVAVDCGGYFEGTRVPALVRKPAPVQCTWLGYPSTLGMRRAFDARIVDAITDPPELDVLATEHLERLPHGFLCFQGADNAPPPAAVPPCVSKGHVTFGSFNKQAKLSEPCLEAWATILERVPRSRLLLKFAFEVQGEDLAALLRPFRAFGLESRVDLLRPIPDGRSHLLAYDLIDVALDPWPYNGTTTTCEALWQGVPVLTLQGDRHSARVGASLVSSVGLHVAESPREYVDKAEAWALSPGWIHEQRLHLRERMAASPLCSGGRFAREMEAAYRHLWRAWCAQG